MKRQCITDDIYSFKRKYPYFLKDKHKKSYCKEIDLLTEVHVYLCLKRSPFRCLYSYLTLLTLCYHYSNISNFRKICNTFMTIFYYYIQVYVGDGLSPVYAGWANIGFQIGGIVVDIIMGFWINKRGSKEPLRVSLFFFGFGNLLYAYAQSCGLHAVLIVITSRTIIGLSTGIYHTVFYMVQCFYY